MQGIISRKFAKRRLLERFKEFILNLMYPKFSSVPAWRIYFFEYSFF